MKHLTLVLIVLLPLFGLNQTSPNKNPKITSLHSSNNSLGGDLSSELGQVSCSIDQVYFSSPYGKNTYVTVRVQPPLVLLVKTIDKANQKFKVVINLEVHGTTLPVTGASVVVHNGKSGGSEFIGNKETNPGGLIRNTSNHTFHV